MHFIHIKTMSVKCPSCGTAVDVSIMCVSTLLGPPVVLCHWCGHAVETGRFEWEDYSASTKLWFVGVSLVYVVLGILLGGLSISSAVHIWQTGGFEKQWEFRTRGFVMGSIFYGGLVIAIQIHRVMCSVERTRISPAERTPLKRPFRSLQIAMHLKFIIFLAIPVLGAYAGQWLGQVFGS